MLSSLSRCCFQQALPTGSGCVCIDVVAPAGDHPGLPWPPRRGPRESCPPPPAANPGAGETVPRSSTHSVTRRARTCFSLRISVHPTGARTTSRGGQKHSANLNTAALRRSAVARGFAPRDVTWVPWQAARAHLHGRSAQLGRPFFDRLQGGEMSPSDPRAFSSRPRHGGAAHRTCVRTRD
jgi:hypothetical protein